MSAGELKDVYFVFDLGVLPDLVILCCGAVIVGDRLFNIYPSQTDSEPSFIVESIACGVLKARLVHGGRSCIFKFRCLDEGEWNERRVA